MRKIFVDGIGEAQVVAGTVRLDLVTLAASGPNTPPTPQPTGEQLVMSVEGFVRLHGQVTGVVEQLVSRGILRRGQPASAAAPEPQKAEAAPRARDRK